MPLKCIQKKVRGINKCPWVNSEIKHDIRERDYFLKKARKSNRYMPLKCIQKKVRGINKCPWVNSEIKHDIRERDYFLKKARKSKRVEEWKNCRTLRNRVTREIKAKEAYNRKLIEENSDNPKTYWKTVKKIMPNKQKTTSSTSI